MRKIFFIFLFYFFFILQTFAWKEAVKDAMIPENTLVIEHKSGRWLLFSIFEYIRDSIFGLLALITITVFIYIWARLLMARWNPEEFKKVLMHFIYAIVWLVIIALSWWIIRMVSSLNF
jgi:hypothetical protein